MRPPNPLGDHRRRPHQVPRQELTNHQPHHRPRRGVLLTAKIAVATLVALATAVVTVACSVGVGQAALTAAELPTASLSAPDTIRAVPCAVANLVLTAILGLALGALTRSSTGALAIIVTVALTPLAGLAVMADFALVTAVPARLALETRDA